MVFPLQSLLTTQSPFLHNLTWRRGDSILVIQNAVSADLVSSALDIKYGNTPYKQLEASGYSWAGGDRFKPDITMVNASVSANKQMVLKAFVSKPSYSIAMQSLLQAIHKLSTTNSAFRTNNPLLLVTVFHANCMPYYPVRWNALKLEINVGGSKAFGKKRWNTRHTR